MYQIRQCHVSTKPRIIPAYDFQRYYKAHNNNQAMQFPVESMEITYFLRPDPYDTDEKILEEQLSQERFNITEINEKLPTYIKHNSMPFYSLDDLRTQDDTLHGDATYLGLLTDETTGKVERYVLKFFSKPQEMNARREVLFSYLFAEAGEVLHVPKIAIQKIGEHTCVIRRFYRGMDGRLVINNDIPIEIEKQLHPKSLVKYYALRYALLGDIDFHNPGNVIFSQSNLTPKVLLHIDGEGILPDEESEKQFLDAEKTEGNIIVGSLAWRKHTSNSVGKNYLFDQMCNSTNILLAYLRLHHTIDEMADLELSPEFVELVLGSRIHFESLIRTFDILPLPTLLEGQADFQKTFDEWERCYAAGKPIKLFNLVTGDYEC